MGASHIDNMSSTTTDCRMWVDDPAGFSTGKVGRLHHDYHRHPLFQLPELEALAKELSPLKQCRFVRPGITLNGFARAEPVSQPRPIFSIQAC